MLNVELFDVLTSKRRLLATKPVHGHSLVGAQLLGLKLLSISVDEIRERFSSSELYLKLYFLKMCPKKLQQNRLL